MGEPLTTTDREILQALRKTGAPRTTREIGDALGIAGAYSQLARLERLHLVDRVQLAEGGQVLWSVSHG